MILSAVARVIAAELARRAAAGVGRRVVREAARRASDPGARRAATEAVGDAVDAAAAVAGGATRLVRGAAVAGAAVAAGVASGVARRAARWRDDGGDGFAASRADADDPGAAGTGRGGVDAAPDERDRLDPARHDPDGAAPMDGDTTHFGYRTVDRKQKASLVGDVFDSVAPSYDVMNDLMSFGVHRLWKRFAIELSAVRPGQRVLDIAGGTGDLAEKLARRVGSGGQVILADINAAMLRTGRERLVDAGVVGNVHYAQGDAEALPFDDDTFDCVTIAFGLRNVTDKARALRSMYRVLKPGGRLIVLEFSKPVLPLLARAYDAYSFTALPLMGRLVANDADSYRYLAESIRVHPDQETLAAMMEEAGFERVEHHNLTGGIVALHKGFKL